MHIYAYLFLHRITALIRLTVDRRMLMVMKKVTLVTKTLMMMKLWMNWYVYICCIDQERDD